MPHLSPLFWGVLSFSFLLFFITLPSLVFPKPALPIFSLTSFKKKFLVKWYDNLYIRFFVSEQFF